MLPHSRPHSPSFSFPQTRSVPLPILILNSQSPFSKKREIPSANRKKEKREEKRHCGKISYFKLEIPKEHRELWFISYETFSKGQIKIIFYRWSESNVRILNKERIFLRPNKVLYIGLYLAEIVNENHKFISITNAKTSSYIFWATW